MASFWRWIVGLGLSSALLAAPPIPTPYARLAELLKSAQARHPEFFTLTEVGKSTQGRSLFLLKASRARKPQIPALRVFFYAQQHGDEIAGKEAMVQWIQALTEDPERLPEDVELYLMPMVNPDGAERFQRRNGADTDLNRDHLLLDQPETRALYRAARGIRPHLAADCHEFARDSEDYLKKGWVAWPVITMDAANHPLIPEPLKELGLAMVNSAEPVLEAAKIPYQRYSVGGPPPDEEIRPSTLEVDDGRNGMGSHGALSFIIESGRWLDESASAADLPSRIQGYRLLFEHLLGTAAYRRHVIVLSEAAQKAGLPPFIATNAFWGNVGGKMLPVKVQERSIDHHSGKVLEIWTPMVMREPIVKTSVPTPQAYVIEARVAAAFKVLLERHGLSYEELQAPRSLNAEACHLLRVEEPYDAVYERYENRQIVSREPAVLHEFPAGSLLVPLAPVERQPLARRAVEILEPCLLYGMYSYPSYRVLAGPGGLLPVWRAR